MPPPTSSTPPGGGPSGRRSCVRTDWQLGAAEAEPDHWQVALQERLSACGGRHQLLWDGTRQVASTQAVCTHSLHPCSALFGDMNAATIGLCNTAQLCSHAHVWQAVRGAGSCGADQPAEAGTCGVKVPSVPRYSTQEPCLTWSNIQDDTRPACTAMQRRHARCMWLRARPRACCRGRADCRHGSDHARARHVHGERATFLTVMLKHRLSLVSAGVELIVHVRSSCFLGCTCARRAGPVRPWRSRQAALCHAVCSDVAHRGPPR